MDRVSVAWTDWYESTGHEFACLYHKLVVGGVLIIDDYGRCRGCRKAVDEFFAALGSRTSLLARTTGSERLCIKKTRK
jgi:O-methyltransferase